MNYIKIFNQLIDENPIALKVLLFLIEQSDEKNISDCSYLLLDGALNISVPTAVRAVKLLEEMKLITIIKTETHHLCEIEASICHFFKG